MTLAVHAALVSEALIPVKIITNTIHQVELHTKKNKTK